MKGGGVFAEPKVVRNINNTWTYSPGAWAVYFLLIIIGRIFCGLVLDHIPWTVVSIVHNLVTYFLFHWVKGIPFHSVYMEAQRGKYDHLTVWEQFDDEVLNTPVRKILTLIPIFLFFLAVQDDQSTLNLIVNSIFLLPILIAKLPAVHKKRFFGINS
eukprot:TRINITY_DN4180_c0_g1_i4.p1 TRINITY_DN4180_c0_g1~~TRINITY_DN4180_c0_g1_i4.p1  ORF type:complete len:157 (-),score=39.05 TRINITY_DN4180_c0_g1_i4:45-515(-)